MIKSTYQLKGISINQADNLQGRSQIILNVVKQNPKINQNQLRNLVCNELGAMAGKTFDALIVELRNTGVLSYERIKNRIHYSVSKNTSQKDLTFLNLLPSEMLRVKKIMKEFKSIFHNLHPSTQMTAIIAFAEYLKYVELTFMIIKPLYDKPNIKQIEKRLIEMRANLKKMSVEMELDYVRLLGGQFFQYSSIKKNEIKELENKHLTKRNISRNNN